MKKEKIILIGGGGHCHAVIDVIELEDKYEIIGIVDKPELIGQKVLGYEIIGCDEDLENIYKTCQNAMVTIGQISSFHLRKKLFDKLEKIGFTLPVVISPLSYVSQYAKIDQGTIVMHQALINANVFIGKNCIVNTNALIEHDTIIENHCHISTASVVNGNVLVKEGTFFGSNAVSKENIEVSGFIKAGSIVK